MQIYANDPLNWMDLQVRVGKIFSDIGFSVEIEKDIPLVRGKVNVDVFAEKRHLTTKEIHIAECKYWKEAIPKHVIHSFRTVLADSGANSGYIISKSGFQEGAFEAAKNSNTNLFNFQEFQDEFRTRWLNEVVDELELIGYNLRKFADPMESFFDKYLGKLSEAKKEEHNRLTHKYYKICMKSFRGLYKNVINGQLEHEWIDQTVTANAADFPDEIHVNCLMDYFQYLKDTCLQGVNEFDAVFGQKIRKS